jgi:hypothetical protein
MVPSQFIFIRAGTLQKSNLPENVNYPLLDLLSGTGWTSGVRFSAGAGIFLFATASRPALRPTQPPVQWIPGAISPVVKLPGREADHSPPSSAEVKNAWSYSPLPQYVFMAWCLIKHRINFRI